MSFAVLVGVTEQFSTCVLAFGAIVHENISSFTWFLERVRDTVGENVINKVSAIATDNDSAFCTPIQQVLPNTYHVLCRWHIAKNIVKNITKELGSQFSLFMDEFYILYNVNKVR